MARQSASSKQAKASHAGRQETFNQIVLMLILAFTFRVFVVELFVIPTGSMAPTLKGAHSRFACENCGYRYDVNYQGVRDTQTDISVPSKIGFIGSHIYCPNCAYPVSEQQRTNTPIHYGDRILVLKYAYLLNPPKRWDVVVFKTPSDFDTYHYNQAYIKRLVGLPGEKVMVLDGDVYVAANSQRPDWQIQQKPDVVQDALWRIVNDTSYGPLGLTPPTAYDRHARGVEDYVPWKSVQKDTWRYSRDETGARAFQFADLIKGGELRFDPTIGYERHPLTDWLAYDQTPGQSRCWPVGDLKMSFFYSRAQGSQGPLELRLSKRNDLFIAQLHSDHVALYRAPLQQPAKMELLARSAYAFSDKPARIDFLNLDYRVRLQVDGKELLSSTAEQYHPDVRALNAEYLSPPVPTVSISAQQQVCTISHLSLWRDIYYTTLTSGGAPIQRGSHAAPVQLTGEEYFVLGDNSPLSGDGRYWSERVHLPAEGVESQAGVVPTRFMLGKAMLVYWPAGFRLLQTSRQSLDAIPNFGEMRFIH